MVRSAVLAKMPGAGELGPLVVGADRAAAGMVIFFGKAGPGLGILAYRQSSGQSPGSKNWQPMCGAADSMRVRAAPLRMASTRKKER
jgi:hypothetical protein